MDSPVTLRINITTERNLTNTSSPENDWRKIDGIAFAIETYYLWVILALGFPGNCATVITIIRMSPARSLTVYIALLAIVDNLAIINKILMFVLTDHNIEIGPIGCKLLGFLGNFLITYANWLLVAMSVERCMAVWYPFKIGQQWTFKKSLVVVMGITVPLLVTFLHLFWTMDYYYDPKAKQVWCLIHDDHVIFMINFWHWINIVLYALLPCFFLIVFNSLIIIGIVQSRKKDRYLNKSNSTSSGNSCTPDRQFQITSMLVSAAVALVLLTTPRCVLLIIGPYQTAVDDTMTGAKLYLIDTIAYVLCDSTHAMNFYIYSFSARQFRKQFIDILLCRKQTRTANNSNYLTLSSRPSARLNVSTFPKSFAKWSIRLQNYD